MSNWTLFSNHGHVLMCLARDPESRLRDVAANVGITERAVQKIVRDLQDGGMVSITKNGRRNRYKIHSKKPLRHDLEAGCSIRELIKTVNKGSMPARKPETGAQSKAITPDIQKPKAQKPPPKDTTSTSARAVKPDKSGDNKRQQGSLF